MHMTSYKESTCSKSYWVSWNLHVMSADFSRVRTCDAGKSTMSYLITSRFHPCARTILWRVPRDGIINKTRESAFETDEFRIKKLTYLFMALRIIWVSFRLAIYIPRIWEKEKTEKILEFRSLFARTT